MTIHQIKAPCFTLEPSPWDEEEYGTPHYDTHAEADAALAEARRYAEGDEEEMAHLAAIKVKRFDEACWVAECDAPDGPEGTCDATLGDEEEGPSCIHFESFDEVTGWMPGERWVQVFVDNALCWTHSPDNPEPVPLSPAEQEAAGQLVIPGVLS